MSSTRIVLVIATVFALFPMFYSPAQAGTNGQQIGVVVCGAKYVDIIGANHRGQQRSYRLWADPNTCVERITTRWWWKGNVTLTKVDASGLRDEMIVQVSGNQPESDISWYTFFGMVHFER